MNVGKRIKARRKQLGMSAEALAQKIGRSAATVYRYENGDISNVSSEILLPIADALSTTPAQLMGWDEIESSLGSDTPAAQQLRVIGGELSRASRPSDPRKAEIIAIYDSMNDAGRESLLLAARGFAGSPAMCQDGASNTEKTV